MPNTLKAGDNITDTVIGLPSWRSLSLQNGWTNQGAPKSLAQWRFIPLMNAIEVVGSIVPGTLTDGTIIGGGISPAPVTQLLQPVTITGGTVVATPVLYLDTSGNLRCQSLPSGVTLVQFRLWFPVDS